MEKYDPILIANILPPIPNGCLAIPDAPQSHSLSHYDEFEPEIIDTVYVNPTRSSPFTETSHILSSQDYDKRLVSAEATKGS